MANSLRDKYPGFFSPQTAVAPRSSFAPISRPEQDEEQAPQEPNATIGEMAGDYARDLAKAVIGFGEAAVGLGDLVTGNLVGNGLQKLGYDPARTRAIIEQGYSEERKLELAEVRAAEGFLDTVIATVTNPGVALGTIIESSPYMLGAAGAVRAAAGRILATRGITPALGEAKYAAEAAKVLGDKAVRAQLATVGAAAEGALGAGAIQESARQQGRGYLESAPAAIGGGLATAAIGKVAGSVGLGDLETAVGTAGLPGREQVLSIGKTIAKDMFQEGVLEELPQSASEQIFTNLATGKPWAEGVPEAAATGLIAGAGMGGGVGLLRGALRPGEEPPAPAPAPEEKLRAATNAGEAVRAAEEMVGDIETLEREAGITPAPTVTPAPVVTPEPVGYGANLAQGRGLLQQAMSGTVSAELPPIERPSELTAEALMSADISAMPAPERQEFLADLTAARTANLPEQRAQALARAAETYGRTVGPIQQPTPRATPAEAISAAQERPAARPEPTAAPDLNALLAADTRAMDEESRADFNAQLSMARANAPGPVQTAALTRAAEIYGRAVGPIQTRQQAQPAAAGAAAPSLRTPVPRPTRILGRPTATYTDDQLTALLDNNDTPAVTRRGIEVELRARADVGQAPAGGTFAPTMAPMQEGLNNDRILTVTAAMPDLGSQPLAGQPAGRQARSAAQTLIDDWASNRGEASPVVFGDPDPADEASFTAIADLLGELTGAKVIAFSDTSENAINGVNLGGYSLVNVGRTQAGVAPTALHEVTHHLEKLAAAERAQGKTGTPAQDYVDQIYEIFDDMTDEGKRAYAGNFLYKDELDGIADPTAREARLQELLQSEELRSEMVSDFMGNRATDREFMEGLAKADPQGFEAFVKRWLAAIDSLLAKLRGVAKETESKKVDSYIRDLNRAKLTAQTALINFRKTTQPAAAGVESPAFKRQEQAREDQSRRTGRVQAGAEAAGRAAGQAGRGPEYGEPVEGAVTVDAVHYSREPRESLSGAYYGTGAPGAEADRLRGPNTAEIRNRIYFYTDTGNGVTPERGVGAIAHRVTLRNIYDASTGVIRAKSVNAFERAVMAAGYDGYLVRDFGQQGAVVVLGSKHNAVPVARDEAPSFSRRSSVAWMKDPSKARKQLGLPATGKVKARALGEAINRVVAADFGAIPADDRSAEAAKDLARAMADEVRYQVKDANSGLGWYSANYPAAVRRLQSRFPELADDAGAQNVFTAILAITSNGEKVRRNLAMATEMYGKWREGATFVSAMPGSRRAPALENNAALLDALLDEHGLDGLRDHLLEELTVKEINAQLRAAGKAAKTAYTADTVMPRAALYFGPKLGAFYANLAGAEGYLTMDLWWSRSINRYRANLLPSPTEKGADRLREMLGLPADADLDTVIEAAKPYWQSYKDRKYKQGTALEKASNTFIKAAMLELNEAPENATDRKFMASAAREAQRLLRRQGLKLSIADIQAALWYYEKRLYAALGVRGRDDIGYEEAINEWATESDRPAGRFTRRGGERRGGSAAARTGAEADRNVRFSRGQDRRGAETGALAQSERAALEGAPVVPGATGPDPGLVAAAEQYARDAGIPYARQTEYVEVDEAFARRIADEYERMAHDPQNPAVREAYEDLIRQTTAQYRALESAGYRFWFTDTANPDNLEYLSTPWNAMRDIRANKTMGVFPTVEGFGSGDLDVSNNPLLQDTGIRWPVGSPDSGRTAAVLANDLFRAVHDAFGHGLEGAGFRARGEENAWQAHARLFTGPALGALTSETRGQNSWLNYGPNGEANQTARVEDTVFAEQKTGLMPEWTWREAAFSRSQAPADSQVQYPVYRGSRSADMQPGRAGAIFFSETPDYANQYATGTGGQVQRVFLDVRNLFDFVDNPQQREQAIQMFNESGGWTESTDGERSDYDPAQDMDWEIFDEPNVGLMQQVRDLGYDAIRFRETENDVAIAVFSPDKVAPAFSRAQDPSAADEVIAFSKRQKPAPKKTITAYKLFRVDPRRPGQLFPLFVNANDPVPFGEWQDADIGPLGEGGKVKSKLGLLAFRPGWHAGDLPIATHIGQKSDSSLRAPDQRAENQVWAEVELAADRDWQKVADERGKNAQGKIIAARAHITDQVPKDGFYRYKTSPNMVGKWLISGSMKVNRLLSDAEVASINAAAGTADLPRPQPFNAKKYGFDEPQFSRAQTNTPEFKRWFGDSKVVDENGQPLVVYHGTRPGVDFDEFFIGGVGAYFTPDISYAEAFTEELFGEEESYGQILPVYLSIKNPMVVRAKDGSPEWREFVDRGILKSDIEAGGFDGAMLIDDETGKIDQIIALDPNQIKSAIGNVGAFNPADPRITFSRAQDELAQAREKRALRSFGKSLGEAVRERAAAMSEAVVTADEEGRYEGIEVGDTLLTDKGFRIRITGKTLGQVSKNMKTGAFGLKPITDADIIELDGKEYTPAFNTETINPQGEVSTGQSRLYLLRGKFTKMGGPRFSRAQNIFGNPLPAGSLGLPDTKMDEIIYYLQDKLVDTKRVVEKITAATGAIADKWDPYLQEKLFHGRTAEQTLDFANNELKPLIEALGRNKVSIEQFDEYLHNRHAEERNVEIAKINPALPDAGSGIPTADARAYLAALPAARRAMLEGLAKRVDAINAGTRQILVDTGLESQSLMNTWQNKYGKYVPLMREELDFDPASGSGIGQGFNVRGSASKRATGSANRKVVDILANIAMQREKAIVRGEKNKVSQAMYGLAIQNPDGQLWLPINPSASKDPAILAAELTSMGLDPLDAQNIAKEPTQSVVDPRTGLVSTRVNTLLRNAETAIGVRVNGQQRYLLLNSQDPRAERMARAMKNLDADQLGRAMSMIAKGTRWFASVNTQYNPIFGIINFMRDVQGGLLNLSSTELAGEQGAVLAGTMPALRGIYGDLRSGAGGQWATLWKEFQKVGGQTGYRSQFSQSEERAEALRDELKALNDGTVKKVGKAVGQWLSDYNTAMENAVRLSAYKTALDRGMSKERAAVLAKDLTVNFNKKGQVATQMGALYAFFNASVQGTTRLAQTLSGPAGKKIIYGGLLLGAAQALAMAAAGFDEDEPPDFTRERNIIIPTGGGKYITIPMPLGFNVIPNTSRILAEWALSGFERTPQRVAQMATAFFEMFNPIGSAGISMQTAAPTVADPLVALFENRDWTGTPIAREDFNSLDPTPGYTRAKDTASVWSKFLSYYLNLATGGTEFAPGVFSPTPDQIDYLIGQVGGGIGREASKIEQTISSALTGEELPPFKVPLVGRLYGDTTGSSAVSSRFYENLRRMNIHNNEITGRREAGRPIGDYLRENPEARLAPEANRVYRQVQSLRRRKRELLERDASRESIRAIEQQITARMERFNARLE